MPCAFCRREVSLKPPEHVWPDWIRKHQPDHGRSARQRLSVSHKTGRAYDIENFKASERKMEIVCAQCNGTWMSDLESLASPILGPMIEGNPSRLRVKQQAIVAFWALKTVMMLQFTRPKHQQAIPAAHFDYVYQRRKPPPNCRIWILGFTGEPYNSSFAIQGHELMARVKVDPLPPERMNAYTATLGINHLVFELVGYVVPGEFNVVPQDHWTDYRRHIWPTYGGTLSWPPPKTFTTQEELFNFCASPR